MPAHDKNVEFDAAAIAPVRYGTPEMEALLAAIGESAAASKAAGNNPFPAIDLVRDSRLGALRVPVNEGGGGCTLREYFALVDGSRGRGGARAGARFRQPGSHRFRTRSSRLLTPSASQSLYRRDRAARGEPDVRTRWRIFDFAYNRTRRTLAQHRDPLVA